MNQLVWFRNDLRIHDNDALETAFATAKETNSKCIALFIHSPDQLASHGSGEIKLSVIRRALGELKSELESANISMVELTLPSWADCGTAIKKLCEESAITDVHCHYEPGLNEYNRDKGVADALGGVAKFHRHNDLYLIHPKTVLNNQGEPFKVFSAYKKAVYRQLLPTHLAPSPSSLKPRKRTKHESDSSWQNPLALPVTESEALAALDAFSQKERAYSEQRDIPSVNGTSQLSTALSIGSISVRTIASAIEHSGTNLLESKYFDELIWREFYKYILYYRPDLCRGAAFNERWDHFSWLNDPDTLKAWKQGRTGVPIVDAAMRQLNETGWMHNRLRMITAMYLVKILQQDWRLGEAYFANKLADFDFAANNGGWQWVASTGVDAVPYFRIFNPYQQSKKFDPQGDFIRNFVPEIAAIDSKHIHQPPEDVALELGYCKPLVDYASMRSDTLTKFKQL